MRTRLLVLAVLLNACGPSCEDRRSVAEYAANVSTDVQQFIAIGDSLFEFGPSFDATKSLEEIAASIQAKATANLAGCGSVQLSGTTVTISAPAPGCTLANGLELSGEIKASVMPAPSSFYPATVFVHVLIEDGDTINGIALAAPVSFYTRDGSAWVLSNKPGLATLANSGGGGYNFDLPVVTDGSAVTINGVASERHDLAAVIHFADVRTRIGQCYPSAGTASVTKKLGEVTDGVPPVETLTEFSEKTPTTGRVHVTSDGTSFDSVLPAYSHCPPP